MSIHHLHRRLDAIDTARAMRRAASLSDLLVEWSYGGHLGNPPFEPLVAPGPKATDATRRIWRLLAQARARSILVTDPDGAPFPDLPTINRLDDAALLAAINSHREGAT